MAHQPHLKPRVLVFVANYLPGYRSGGPLRTIASMVEQLGNRLDFWIVTSDRDRGDRVPFASVRVNDWNEVGNATVYYASPGSLTPKTLLALTRTVSPDVIYLNSFFSRISMQMMGLRWLRLFGATPLILAPRGEFATGALGIKSWRKRMFMNAALPLGIYRGVVWQASSVHEQQDIERSVGTQQIVVAPDLSRQMNRASAYVADRPPKEPNAVQLVFLARITRMKHLQFALEMLATVRGDVHLDIYGPISDGAYWASCQSTIAQLPSHITVRYCGEVHTDDVEQTLSRYHFLIQPSLGENFGHVILEALSCGCPVIISDRTPWRNLAQHHAGWDLSLDDRDRWQQTLQACVDMDAATYGDYAEGANQLALAFHADPQIERQNLDLFEIAQRQRSVTLASR